MSKNVEPTASPPRIDSHAIAEHARLISHRHYAEILREDAKLLTLARSTIDAEVHAGGTLGQRLWQLLLKEPCETIIAGMLQNSEIGALLRSNSPFSTLIGVTDRRDRSEIWRQAKSDLLAKKTLTAPFVA